ncbi:hypothetical protein DM793_12785 [Paenarthrobacter nitroguajacolicus]|nr:hypothetical protein [Paenarthrobacter nitroguajacolicus]
MEMAVASKATVDGMALSSGHRIVADLSLDPTAEGGLREPLPSGTPSLILEFHDQNGKTQLGARIETACGEPLRPGENVLAARAVFWADEARIYATEGQQFDLWYGRHVGHGVIRQILVEI